MLWTAVWAMVFDRRAVWVAAVLVPVAAAVCLVPLRGVVESTNIALVLVVAVVAVAAASPRPAGVCAALSAGLSFDFFFTRPFHSLKIRDSADVETTLLLLLVGLAVSEIAAWGRRQRAAAVRLEGYSDGIRAAVGAIDDSAPLDVLLAQTAQQLAQVLQLPSARFDYGSGIVGGDHPRLRPDGEVEVNGTECDVERYGLPVGHDLEILLTGEGRYLGRFVVAPRAGARPSLQQRLAAVTLADRAAAAVVRHRVAPSD